jgi:hypothetical protein
VRVGEDLRHIGLRARVKETTVTESTRKLGQSAGSDEDDQDLEDRQREWLQSLASDAWQSQLGLYRELIDRVADVRYPSPAMFDMIERGMPPELYRDYIATLTDKVYDAKYPSPALLARLQRLTRVAGP